jgi:hypothetical protein
MLARDDNRICPVCTTEGHAEWKAVSVAAARKRSALPERPRLAATRPSSSPLWPQPRPRPPRRRRALAQRAAAGRARPAGSERRAIVKKLNLLKELPVSLDSGAPVDAMKKPDVVAALCEEGCGLMEKLCAGAALEAQRAEMAALVRTRGGLQEAVAAGKRGRGAR